MTTCPACDSREVRTLRTVDDGPFTLARCQACALVFVEPPLSEAELAAYYPDAFYGAAGAGARIATALFLRARARLAERAVRGPARLLDVGCGAGQFLRHMRERGWTVAGVESSASGRARASDLEVHATVEALGARSFELITLWQVAEHVRAVVPMLRALVSRLAPGGRILISVPNAGSLEARLFRDRWFHQDVPRHQLQLDRESVLGVLARSGLALERWEGGSIEYDPFGLVQSAHNLLPIERNALYQLLKHGRRFSSFSVKDRAVLALLAAGLPAATLAAIGAEAALSRARLGGTLTLVARPVDSPGLPR